MERNDDHHSGGFKRNNSNNFGNRGSNNSSGTSTNSGYRNWNEFSLFEHLIDFEMKLNNGNSKQ